MTTKHGLLFAATLALVAVLYQVEVLTSRWQADDHAMVPAPVPQLWKFLSNPDNIDKWFQWVPRLQAVDSRPLAVGKRFEAIYHWPIIGDYAQPMQVVEFVPQRKLVLQSDSLLKPRFTLSLDQEGDDHTKVALSLVFRRNSALFRCTVGPLLWLLSSQQLRQSLFLVKMLFRA